MVGPFRRFATLMALGLLFASSIGAVGSGRDPEVGPDRPGARPTPGEFALPGEDPPRAFVPAHPRTVEEQRRVEALRYYAAARALEDRRQFNDAIKTLEKALASDPESTAALRRLSRINFAMGRETPAVAYSRRVLAADPGDLETLALLVGHYKEDPPAAEALLNEVAKNPKLVKNSVGALYVEYRAGGHLRGLAPLRQGRGVLRQGRRGPGREVERPALPVRPPAIPRQRRGPGLSPLRPGLPPGQEDRPGHQGLPARAGLRPGRAAPPALPLPDLPGGRPGRRGPRRPSSGSSSASPGAARPMTCSPGS